MLLAYDLLAQHLPAFRLVCEHAEKQIYEPILKGTRLETNQQTPASLLGFLEGVTVGLIEAESEAQAAQAATPVSAAAD
jgi:hypothetical protein